MGAVAWCSGTVGPRHVVSTAPNRGRTCQCWHGMGTESDVRELKWQLSGFLVLTPIWCRRPLARKPQLQPDSGLPHHKLPLIYRPQTVVDNGTSVIDMCAVEADGAVHRFFKEDSFRQDSPGLCHEVGEHFFAEPFSRLSSNIGNDLYPQVEGPVVFADNHRRDRWYLMVDQYMEQPQGYVGLFTDDISSGRWSWTPGFSMPPNTKHGSVLALSPREWERIDRVFGPSAPTSRGPDH